MLPAGVLGSAPLPYYMVFGNTLKMDIPKGTVITADMVEEPSGSILWDLRKKQDAAFLK